MAEIMRIRSGNWEEQTLTLMGMPKTFILSAREVVVVEADEYEYLISLSKLLFPKHQPHMECPHCKKEVFEGGHDVTDLYEEKCSIDPNCPIVLECDKKNVIAELQAELDGVDEKFSNCHKAIDALESRAKGLQAELDQHRWIPVSERLPSEEKDVLVWAKEKYFQISWYCLEDKRWMFLQYPPTHWKPIILPEKE
jgi:hypothetical protein